MHQRYGPDPHSKSWMGYPQQTAQFYVLYLCWRANLDWGKLTAKVQQSGGISHLQHQLIFFMFEYIFYSTRNCGTRIKKLSKDSFVYYTSVHLFRETLYLVEARRTLVPLLWLVVKHSMHNFSWTVKGLRQKGNGKLPIHFKKYILFVLRLMSCIILLTEIKGVNF